MLQDTEKSDKFINKITILFKLPYIGTEVNLLLLFWPVFTGIS